MKITFIQDIIKVELTIPSLSMVALTCSEPGVTLNGVADFIPCLSASLAIDAHLAISS